MSGKKLVSCLNDWLRIKVISSNSLGPEFGLHEDNRLGCNILKIPLGNISYTAKF